MMDEAHKAVSSGPHEPVARERPIHEEPTVVVAWDDAPVAVAPASAPPPATEPAATAAAAKAPWDGGPHTNPNFVRPAMDTIPPERELEVSARQARFHSRLITFAAVLLFASAGLLAKGATDPTSPLSQSELWSALRSRVSERVAERVVDPREPARTTGAMLPSAPVPETISQPVAVAPPPAPPPPTIEFSADVPLDTAPSTTPGATEPAPTKPKTPEAARLATAAKAPARPARAVPRKSRGDIVRDNPF